MNTLILASSSGLTVAELKRRGMAAIEDGLRCGPVRIFKRNKAAAVVLSEGDYLRLTAAANSQATLPGLSAMDWLLAHPAQGKRRKTDIDRQLAAERDW
jgi:PHD/YefM family antitoxin component YafN of YafNO toxin-antitoxin module